MQGSIVARLFHFAHIVEVFYIITTFDMKGCMISLMFLINLFFNGQIIVFFTVQY